MPAGTTEYGFVSDYSESLNREQKIAVKHIVEKRNGELPFLLYGPPG